MNCSDLVDRFQLRSGHYMGIKISKPKVKESSTEKEDEVWSGVLEGGEWTPSEAELRAFEIKRRVIERAEARKADEDRRAEAVSSFRVKAPCVGDGVLVLADGIQIEIKGIRISPRAERGEMKKLIISCDNHSEIPERFTYPASGWSRKKVKVKDSEVKENTFMKELRDL